jgi:hypothetical protein
VQRRAERTWGFDDEERAWLLSATEGLPELRAMVSSAQRRDDVGRLWIVQTTLGDLDDVFSLIEAKMARTRSQKQRELLDGMLATLCNAMDRY